MKRVESRFVQSVPFRHLVFSRSACLDSEEGPVFVFLGGDGQSWIRDGRVSADPTPTRAVAIELLGVEPTCGIAVSRPCTFGLVDLDDACEPSVWTTRRYSSDVIRSMVSVIERAVPPRREIVLVGFSGGGLLAMHVASALAGVSAVVTLGAPLELGMWLEYHGYTDEILAHTPDLTRISRSGLVVLHVAGSDDLVTPLELAERMLDSLRSGELMLLEDADHTCCWARDWSRIRRRLLEGMATEPDGTGDSPDRLTGSAARAPLEARRALHDGLRDSREYRAAP